MATVVCPNCGCTLDLKVASVQESPGDEEQAPGSPTLPGSERSAVTAEHRREFEGSFNGSVPSARG